MIHPHIGPCTNLTVRTGPKNLIATVSIQDCTFTIPLPTGRVERTLDNLLLHIASGLSPSKILTHFSDHIHPESSCPCCKLEGRVLTGSGRKTVRSEDLFRASRSHHTGTVQVRHLAPGLTGAQIAALDRRRASAKPTVAPVKFVSTPLEELI